MEDSWTEAMAITTDQYLEKKEMWHKGGQR